MNFLAHKPLKEKIKISVFVLFGLIAAGAFIYFSVHDADELRRFVSNILSTAQGTPWALPLVLGVYLLSCLTMFPIIIVNLATALVFGPVNGFLYALSGTMLSSIVFFFVGRFGRDKGLKKYISGPRAKAVDKKLHNAGVVGIATLRLIPMAPYGVFNLVAGITSVRFIDYIAGTFLAFLPGGLARAIVGDTLIDLLMNPSQKTFLYLVVGVTLWALTVISLHFGLKKYRHSS